MGSVAQAPASQAEAWLCPLDEAWTLPRTTVPISAFRPRPGGIANSHRACAADLLLVHLRVVYWVPECQKEKNKMVQGSQVFEGKHEGILFLWKIRQSCMFNMSYIVSVLKEGSTRHCKEPGPAWLTGRDGGRGLLGGGVSFPPGKCVQGVLGLEALGTGL